MDKRVEELVGQLVEWAARQVAESHGYVFPCGDVELDDSFLFWGKRVLSHSSLALITSEKITIYGKPVYTCIPVKELLEVKDNG